MSKLAALLIGDFRREEFRQVENVIRTAGAVTIAADVSQAVRVIARTSGRHQGSPPDLVVLACQWPGQFKHRDLAALKQQLPLARFLSVLGAWCEGETRTGSPWPGMLRTYWHHWLPYWSGEIERFLDGRITNWGLQQTATDDERSMLPAIAARGREGLVLIKSESFDMAEMLCHACRAHGYGSVWIPPGQQAFIEGVVAVLWEAAVIELAEIAICRSNYPNAPVIALADFPRVEDARQAAEVGVAVVMGKPLNIDNLFGQLNKLIEASQIIAGGLRPEAKHREVA